MRTLNPKEQAALVRLRNMLEAGREPLIDHSLQAQTPSVLAAAATGTAIVVRPYEPGVIVKLTGFAFDPAGGAEVDTMAERMHEKYLSALVEVQGRPKTNGLYESLYTLVPKNVLWIVDQGDLITTTFKHEATGGIASLHGRLTFGFVPFSLLG